MFIKNKKNGNVIVISAPSGAGKTSICNAVTNEDKNIVFITSYTTRHIRNNEINGKEYFFISKIKFKNMIKKNEFIEWGIVHGNYYGTPKVELEKLLGIGKNVLLEIDVRGSMIIKEKYPKACMIFIMTPDLKTLKNRLILRNNDCKKMIKMRYSNAKEELKFINKYEYLVINENLNNAVEAVKIIIKSLKYKIKNHC
ncbi:MAG: guanylate kinase [Endomicrobium sp.]|jgi:guanylate kinase|nr:guanylate kinase [Endomicrobium sp.]